MLENYFEDAFGVIHQRCIGEFKKDYASQYNSYGEKSNYLSYLRLGYICASLGKIPNSILDIGYGNGDFLKASKTIIDECYGYDISNAPVPDGCKKIDKDLIENKYYNVITMFDSYEHIDDLNFIKNLFCNLLVISVPNCKNPHSNEWFENWKHRRPNEHIHHFNVYSLRRYVEYVSGLKYCNHMFIEDSIRKDEKEKHNILTMCFKS